MIDLVDDNNFKIEKDFDFFCFRGEIFIKNKSNFESVLNYREAFEADFSELRQDPEFITKFSELDALVNHVGTNRMHLRRMSAIRQKGFYADEAFMQLLHENYREYGLEINFDADGKIIPCAATCADIMTALLDHRLRSGFSNNLYDVQNTTPVEA